MIISFSFSTLLRRSAELDRTPDATAKKRVTFQRSFSFVSLCAFRVRAGSIFCVAWESIFFFFLFCSVSFAPLDSSAVVFGAHARKDGEGYARAPQLSPVTPAAFIFCRVRSVGVLRLAPTTTALFRTLSRRASGVYFLRADSVYSLRYIFPARFASCAPSACSGGGARGAAGRKLPAVVMINSDLLTFCAFVITCGRYACAHGSPALSSLAPLVFMRGHPFARAAVRSASGVPAPREIIQKHKKKILSG